MKKHVFVLLVALFLLTSCGEKDSGNDLSKPPELTVVCGEASTEAVKGTFEWSYPQKDGTTAHIIADALLPLEMEELLTPLVMKPSPLSHIDPRTAYLIFDGPLPDRLQLYRWHDDLCVPARFLKRKCFRHFHHFTLKNYPFLSIFLCKTLIF